MSLAINGGGGGGGGEIIWSLTVLALNSNSFLG